MNLQSEIKNLKERYRKIFLNSLENLKTSSSVEDIFKQLMEKKAFIAKKRDDYKCNGCASCCKFAASEFSPEQLTQKAKNGDEFAKQFTQTFIPYENIEDAKKIYPQYVDLLKETSEDTVYFYHCPKVTKDNKCPDYENRPQICRDFPDNPIGFLPPKCAFSKWKEEVTDLALEIKAVHEILEFYKSRS